MGLLDTWLDDPRKQKFFTELGEYPGQVKEEFMRHAESIRPELSPMIQGFPALGMAWSWLTPALMGASEDVGEKVAPHLNEVLANRLRRYQSAGMMGDRELKGEITGEQIAPVVAMAAMWPFGGRGSKTPFNPKSFRAAAENIKTQTSDTYVGKYLSKSLDDLSENIGNIFNLPQFPQLATSAGPAAGLSMMSGGGGGRGGRPSGGGIWPKGRKDRELENKARQEDKAKRLVTPLGEVDTPPELKSIDPQEITPYTEYREAINNMLEASRAKKLEYGNLSPNVSNPETEVGRPTKDWRGNWTTQAVQGAELTERQREVLESQNKRIEENFGFWDKRVDRLEELAGQLENAESGFKLADRKWMDRDGDPIFPFKDSSLPGYLFEPEFEGFLKDLDIQADEFFARDTPLAEEARAKRVQLAEEGIKGKKHKFKTKRKIEVSGGVKISDDEYNLGIRQLHFNKDGGLTDSGVNLLREHDIVLKTFAERNKKKISPDQDALGRFAEIKRREEEKILHKLGRLRQRERDWDEYRRVGRTLDPDAPAGEMEQQMERSYEESLARDQAKREYYEGLSGGESEEYMKYLQGEIKRLKGGKITDDLESVKGKQTQAAKTAGINRNKAPPTWEHYWANLFKTPDTPVDELMSRVDPDLKGKDLVDAATEVLLEDEIQFIEPLDNRIAKGPFSRFYYHYREYLIEGPEKVPLDESQIELKLDRLMDLTRRRYRSKAEQLLLEKGHITKDDTRMRWED